ncbi:MAG: hypothetical protein ACOX7R_06535 [Acetivibrionales bacterium]|jgi:hypothetical protein
MAQQKQNILNQNIGPEDEVENIVDNLVMEDECKYFNFLINASNLANLTNTYNASHFQVNAIFVLISPYCIKDLNMNDFKLNVTVGENGSISVGDKVFDALEIKPGIKVFGILKKNEE